jgi:hypothetical protein
MGASRPPHNDIIVARTRMTTEREAFLISLSDRLFRMAIQRFDDLSASERVFVLVWEVEAEVNNGGFHQFFLNSAGDRASATPAALRAIRAERMASILDRANSAFPDGPPSDRSVRQSLLEAIDPDIELFEELDQEFYGYPDDLSALLYQFVIEHRSDIRGT